MRLNHKNRIKKVFYFITLILSCFPLMLKALPSDAQEKIHITTNSSFFNYKTGLKIYEGDVKMDQGTSHLTADRVVTKNNDKNKMNEAIAYGIDKLAEYSTIAKEGDGLFLAKAKIIKFYPLKEMIILEGDVTVTQGKNSFKGSRIIYNTKDQIVTAPATKGSRATIVIEPKQLKL